MKLFISPILASILAFSIDFTQPRVIIFIFIITLCATVIQYAKDYSLSQKFQWLNFSVTMSSSIFFGLIVAFASDIFLYKELVHPEAAVYLAVALGAIFGEQAGKFILLIGAKYTGKQVGITLSAEEVELILVGRAKTEEKSPKDKEYSNHHHHHD